MERISEWLMEYIHETEKEAKLLQVAEIDARVAGVMAMRRAKDAETFAEAMTTAHFTHYFSDALSRMFFNDYNYQRGSWVNYTKPDTAPDFRDVDRFRMSEPGTLYNRREKAEMKATYVAESEVTYGVDEFARQFDISWRTIQNDDLGKLRDTPTRMARAAARFEDGFVSALYDNATTQATMVGLGAVYAGTGRLTAANLAIGINAMAQRVDVGGNRIQITGINLVVPTILDMQARVLMQSALMPSTPNNDKNVLPGFIRAVYIDPYIGFAGANVPWYLFADPAEIPTVPVVRLEGTPSPWTFMKTPDLRVISGTAPAAFAMGSFATGDIEYGVEDIIGGWDDAAYVGVVDPNGLYYSSGTTP